MVSETRSHRAAALRNVGIHLFYFLSGHINSDIELYPPTRQFFSSCIDILGKVTIFH